MSHGSEATEDGGGVLLIGEPRGTMAAPALMLCSCKCELGRGVLRHLALKDTMGEVAEGDGS